MMHHAVSSRALPSSWLRRVHRFMPSLQAVAETAASTAPTKLHPVAVDSLCQALPGYRHRQSVNMLQPCLLLLALPPAVVAVLLLRLAGALPVATAKLLTKDNDLHGVVAGQHAGTGDSTQDVGTCTLEHGGHALLGQNLASTMQRRAVLDCLP